MSDMPPSYMLTPAVERLRYATLLASGDLGLIMFDDDPNTAVPNSYLVARISPLTGEILESQDGLGMCEANEMLNLPKRGD